MKHVLRTPMIAIGLLSSSLLLATAQATTVNYELDYPAYSTPSTQTRKQVVQDIEQKLTALDHQGEFLEYPGKGNTGSSLTRAQVREQLKDWLATHSTYVEY